MNICDALDYEHKCITSLKLDIKESIYYCDYNRTANIFGIVSILNYAYIYKDGKLIDKTITKDNIINIFDNGTYNFDNTNTYRYLFNMLIFHDS